MTATPGPPAVLNGDVAFEGASAVEESAQHMDFEASIMAISLSDLLDTRLKKECLTGL